VYELLLIAALIVQGVYNTLGTIAVCYLIFNFKLMEREIMAQSGINDTVQEAIGMLRKQEEALDLAVTSLKERYDSLQAVNDELLKRAEAADDEGALRDVIAEMSGKLQDEIDRIGHIGVKADLKGVTFGASSQPPAESSDANTSGLGSFGDESGRISPEAIGAGINAQTGNALPGGSSQPSGTAQGEDASDVTGAADEKTQGTQTGVTAPGERIDRDVATTDKETV
jgi:hypothetical protein